MQAAARRLLATNSHTCARRDTALPVKTFTIIKTFGGGAKLPSADDFRKNLLKDDNILSS